MNFSLELVFVQKMRPFNANLVFCPTETAHPIAHSVFLIRDPRNNKCSDINGNARLCFRSVSLCDAR